LVAAALCSRPLSADAELTGTWVNVWGSSQEDGGYAYGGEAPGVAVARDGATYVAGIVAGAVDGQPAVGGKDMCLVRISADGTREWIRIWGTPSSDEAGGVAVDSNGCALVAGSSWGSIGSYTNLGQYDFVLSKFDPAGSNLWTRMWGSDNADEARDVAVADDGTIYVAGHARGTIGEQEPVGGRDLCLTKLDANGNVLWVCIWGSTADDYGSAVAVSHAGDVYVAGEAGGSIDGQPFSGTWDACLSRISSSGTHEWTRQWGNTGLDRALDVALDGATLYVTGHGGGFGGQLPVGGGDAFLCRYTTTGSVDWVEIWGSTGADAGTGVGVTPDRQVHVTGMASWMHSFDGQPKNQYSFWSEFTPDGTGRVSRVWGGSNAEAQSLAIGNAPRLVAAGVTYGGLEGQPGIGGQDLFAKAWGEPVPPFTFIHGPAVTNLMTNAFTLVWSTSRPADARVHYGTKPGTYTDTAFGSGLDTNLSVQLTGLAPDTLYYFVAESVADNDRIAVTSSVRTASMAVGTRMSSVFLAGHPKCSAFRTDASGEVARVEFLIDGVRVGTDYGEPFQWERALSELEINPVLFAGVHTVMARVFDVHGRTRTVHADVSFFERWSERDIRVRFNDPWREHTIYTDTDVMPASGFTADVSAWEQGTTSRQIYPGEIRIVETNIPVDSVSFTLDGLPRGTAPAHVPGDPLRFQHWIDTTGVSTGYHTVYGRAHTTDGYCGTESIYLTVVKRLPDLELSRTITRNGTYFTVETTILNDGLRAANVLSVTEGMNGLLATDVRALSPAVAHVCTSRYDAVSRRCTVQTDFTPAAQPLAPGASVRIRYDAVPAMYPMGIGYGIGLDSAVTYELDGSVHTEPVGGPTALADDVPLADAIDNALAASDYLIITSPRALYDTYDGDGVNRLLERAAMLATEREGVFGLFDPIGLLRSVWRNGDGLAFGDLFGNAGEELVTASIAHDLVRAEQFFLDTRELSVDDPGGTQVFPFSAAFGSGDVLAMGNVIPRTTGGGDHSREEIVLGVDDHLRVYAFNVDGSGTFTETDRDVRREAGSDVVVGNFLSDTADLTDEIAVVDELGRIRIYRVTGGAPYVLVAHEQFDTGTLAGDILAAGNITATGNDDQLVVGDIDDDRIKVYDPYNDTYVLSWPYHVDRTLDVGDGLACGNVVGDAAEEIIFADESEDRIEIIGYDPAVGDLDSLMTFTIDYSAGDRVLTWHTVDGARDRLCFARCSTTAGGGGTGIDVLTTINGAVSRRNRYDLEALLNTGHPWANRMRTNWSRDGFLVILGGIDVIPTFKTQYDYYGDTWRVPYCDDRYASTEDDDVRPELRCSRLVGDSPAKMIVPIESALDINPGPRQLSRGSALAVRGLNRGASGSADDIDFSDYVDDARDAMSDVSFDTRDTEHTPDGYDVNAFMAEADDYDFIYLAGHGSPRTWDVITGSTIRASMRFSTHRPLVYGASCKTGTYPRNGSLAESFLEAGASSYVGAAANGRGFPCFDLSVEFIIRLDEGTIGNALRAAKRDLADDGCVGSPRRARQYNCSVFHLFGDPKLEMINTSPAGSPASGPAAHAELSSDEYDIVGPVAELQMAIPAYQVERTNGYDHVTIDGAKALADADRPIVPAWPVSVLFPAGVIVQDVTLAERAKPQPADGLNLPLGHVRVPGEQGGADAESAPKPGVWPPVDFSWTLASAAGNATVLEVTAYPFMADAVQRTADFFDSYRFDISYATSEVWFVSIETDTPTPAVGDTVGIEIDLRNEGATPLDLTLETQVRQLSDGSTSHVEIATLDDALGVCRYGFAWATAPSTPGGPYSIDATLRDSGGTILARRSHPLDLYGAEPGVALGLFDVPSDFLAGESVTFSARVDNVEGDTADGILTVIIEDAGGEEFAVFEEEFALPALGSQMFSMVWSNASLVARNCRFRAHVTCDGIADPAWHHLAWENADLLQSGVTVGPTTGNRMVEWWSLPDRRYDVLFRTSLRSGDYICIASNLSVDYPVGCYTDTVVRARGFYRIRELDD